MVREGGVEPPHPFEYTDLNRARLPIPPLARERGKPNSGDGASEGRCSFSEPARSRVLGCRNRIGNGPRC